MFHKLFDKVVVINLDRSEGRLRSISSQCHSIGTHFERVSAIDGSNSNVVKSTFTTTEFNKYWDGWNLGANGLVHTTISIIEKAKKDKLDNILILEDDIIFRNNSYENVKNAFNELPKDWELFHLNLHHLDSPIPIGTYLARCSSGWSCQAYAVRSSVFDLYLEWLRLHDRPIDSITKDVIHRRGNSYCCIPKIIDTIPNVSTIRDRFINYGY